MLCFLFFFFKQKTAYEMRISDWSSECALPISLEARDGNMVGPCLGDTGGHRADTDFRHQLHGDARGRIDVAQVVDELRQVLDRIDVEIGRASCRGRVCQYV